MNTISPQFFIEQLQDTDNKNSNIFIMELTQAVDRDTSRNSNQNSTKSATCSHNSALSMEFNRKLSISSVTWESVSTLEDICNEDDVGQTHFVRLAKK